MDKDTYTALNTEDRVNYLNSEMAAGKKLSHICKGLNIADNITTPLRKKGFIRNTEGLFIKQDQHPGQISLDQLPEPTEAPLDTNTNENLITLGSEHNEVMDTHLVPPEQKRMGRPPRDGGPVKKLTIEIDQDIYKALLHYKIDEGLYVNAYLEELIKNALPEKYLRSR